MAETLLFEDATRKVFKVTSDGIQPGARGYWESVRTEWKAGTTQANADTLRSRAIAALTANATFLAIASPSNVQIAAQVRLLTKQQNALIRLLLGLLADVSDTA